MRRALVLTALLLALAAAAIWLAYRRDIGALNARMQAALVVQT